MDPNQVKVSYARWAPIYDHTFGAVTRIGRRRSVEYINNLPGDRVLEVGVGTAMALRHYRPDIEVTGIDFSHDMLGKARAKVQELGLKQVVTLKQMDAREIEFPDNSFDAVVGMHLVSVVPEPERVIAEMARVCKPGGKVIITNHFAHESGILAVAERISARFYDVLGWHSDFSIDTVLGEPSLQIVEQQKFPPLRMMTFLVLQKAANC